MNVLGPLLIAVMISVAAPRSLIACSCAGPTPPCARMTYDVVFVGRVLDGHRDTIDGQLRMIHTLIVTRPVKGVGANQHVVVETGMGGGDCGIGFENDTSYVVYGAVRNGRVLTNTCARTGRVSWNGKDIRYFQAIEVSPSWSVVYGHVQQRMDEGGPGRELARIIVEGNGVRRIALADQHGFFEIGGLPDGRYRVQWDRPDGETSYPSKKFVDVNGHACVEVRFSWKEDEE